MNKRNLVIFLTVLALCQSMDVDAKMTKEAHALYQQACSYEYKNDFKNAINTIQKAIDINGEDAMLYTKIAGLYADDGQYEEALSAYKKAVKLRPNDAFIYISIGNILEQIGDYENAYNSYIQAQQIYPEYKYNYLNIANIEYHRRNYQSAIDSYKIFLNAYPEHQEANKYLANIYYETGEAQKACDIYYTLYKKFPTAFNEYLQYGLSLYETHQYQPAIEMLEKAKLDNPDDEVLLSRLALSYQNLEENDKALATYEELFAINPNLTALKFDYANLLGNMKQYDKAIEQYKVYLKAFPEDADAYRNLGLVYKAMDNNELALLNFEKSYTKDSSNVETKKELALAYHKKQDYNNALKYYDFALKSEPDNYELLANKALTLHAMNNYVASIELYKELLAKQSNERLQQNLTSASIAYGYSLFDKKDYGQAILYFEDAIELAPKEASAYFGLAQANEKMGVIDVAYENYKKAVEYSDNVNYKNSLEKFTTVHKELLAKSMSEKPVKPINEQAINYDNLIKYGDEAYKSQKYNEAIDYYTKAVIYIPDDKITMLKIANIYKLMGNNAKAISFYDRIISIDEKNVDANFNKGLVLVTQKNYSQAIECFKKVIETSPDYPYAYYSLGLAYEQIGEKDKALEYYYLYTGLESDEKMINNINQKIKKLEG